MRTVGADRTHIDYWQSARVVHRGLTTRFGIRIEAGSCQSIVRIGNESTKTFGKVHPLPAERNSLPFFLDMIVRDHMLNCGYSDLMEVLSGQKPFGAAVESPSNFEIKREVVSQPSRRLPHAS